MIVEQKQIEVGSSVWVCTREITGNGEVVRINRDKSCSVEVGGEIYPRIPLKDITLQD
jgi:hypothetical protein